MRMRQIGLINGDTMSSESKDELNGEIETITEKSEQESNVLLANLETKKSKLVISEVKDELTADTKVEIKQKTSTGISNGETIQVNNAVNGPHENESIEQLALNTSDGHCEETENADAKVDAECCNTEIPSVCTIDTDSANTSGIQEECVANVNSVEQKEETLPNELKRSIVENVFSRFIEEETKPKTTVEDTCNSEETNCQETCNTVTDGAGITEICADENNFTDLSSSKEAQSEKAEIQSEKESFQVTECHSVSNLSVDSPEPAALSKITADSEQEQSECKTAGYVNAVDDNEKDTDNNLECPHLEPEVPMELDFSPSHSSTDFNRNYENNENSVKVSEPTPNNSEDENDASKDDADKFMGEENSLKNENLLEMNIENDGNEKNVQDSIQDDSHRETEKVIMYHEDTVRFVEKTETNTSACNKENSIILNNMPNGSEETENEDKGVDSNNFGFSEKKIVDAKPSHEPLSTKPKGQKLDELLSKIATKANNDLKIPKKAKARKSFSQPGHALEKTVVSNMSVTAASITNLTFNVKMLEKQGVLDIPKVHNKRKAFEPFKLKVKQSDNVEKSPVKLTTVKSPVKSSKEHPFFNTSKVIKGRRRKKKKMGSYKLPSEKKQKSARERKKASEDRQIISDDEKCDKNRKLGDTEMEHSVDQEVYSDKMDISETNISQTEYIMEASPLSQTSVKSIENEQRTELKQPNALDILTKNSKLPFSTNADQSMNKNKKCVGPGVVRDSHTRTLDAFLKRFNTKVPATTSQGLSSMSERSGGTPNQESLDVLSSFLRKRKAADETGLTLEKTPPGQEGESQEEKKRKTENPVGISPPPQQMMILAGSPPMPGAARPVIPTPGSISQTSPVTFTQLTSPNSKQPKTLIQNGTLNGVPVFQIIQNGNLGPGQIVAIGTQGQSLLPGSLPKTAILQSPPRLPGAPPGMPVILTPVAMPVVSSGTATPTQNQVSLLSPNSYGNVNLANKTLVSPVNSSNQMTTMKPAIPPIAAPIPLSLFNQSIVPSPTQTNGQQLLSMLNHISKSQLDPNLLKVSHIPNGLYPVTPPRTPDNQAGSDSGSQESVGVSPGQQVSPEKDIIPLCTCKLNGASFPKLVASVTYCQALDSVDNKAMGCCNKVTNSQLVRPAVKIPFMAVCENHRKRLKVHQCCPGCGHFCTQGKFLQCRNEGNQIVHNFHEQCQVIKDGKNYCPHCGEASAQVEVSLKLQEKKPSAIETKSSRMQTKAKMAVAEKKGVGSGDESSEETVVVLEKTKKVLSTNDIPMGPDKHSLERVLSSLAIERPKKYRHLPKCLYTPAYDNDLERVVYMLEDGFDPNEKYDDLEGQGAIHAAAAIGSLPIVHILIQAGASPHLQDKTLRTPLTFAAENNHHHVVKYLLKAGAVIESKADDGMTSLHYAAKAGHVGIIKILLDVDGLDIDVKDDGGYTPLIWAAEHEQLEVVKYLLKRNADPNLRDSEENTALHWAAFSGSANVAEVLLNAGCELDSLNMHGDRPLHIASRQDHYECAVLFLARGADVELKNNKGETPVECCIDENSPTQLALRVNKQLKGFGAKYMGRPEKLLSRDISKGRENIPIPCVNAIDDDGIPTDYLYVTDNIETKCLNVNRVIGSLQSCQCKDDCSSIYCACGKSSVKCWYDKFGRLLPEFNMLEPSLIFECNRACECWTTCNNRVVQNGVMSRLQVFKTEGRGWGCKTLVTIPRGTFICEYIGEHISDHEADRREDDSYLFDLDNKDGETYCIDARKYGNVARFINHLCEPNLVPVKVFVDSQDLRFPRICLFASRDILAQEELGFDYGEKFWIIKWKHFTCTCGSPKCRYSKETIHKTLEEYRLRHEEDVETTQE